MRVFSNSAMSLDGKLASFNHDHVAIGSKEDRRFMSVLRAQADAILVGGATFRNWALPLVEDPDVARSRRPRPVLNVVLTRSGRAPRAGRFFEDARTLPVFLGGADADLGGFARGDVHRARGPVTVQWALALMEQRYGVENLLVEAGGDIIFQLLGADLLDELYVTICPWLVGGARSPTLADGGGFTAEQMRRVELLSHRQVEGELFLHYRVIKGQG